LQFWRQYSKSGIRSNHSSNLHILKGMIWLYNGYLWVLIAISYCSNSVDDNANLQILKKVRLKATDLSLNITVSAPIFQLRATTDLSPGARRTTFRRLFSFHLRFGEVRLSVWPSITFDNRG
jgi:hypothetical protein